MVLAFMLLLLYFFFFFLNDPPPPDISPLPLPAALPFFWDPAYYHRRCNTGRRDGIGIPKQWPVRHAGGFSGAVKDKSAATRIPFSLRSKEGLYSIFEIGRAHV